MCTDRRAASPTSTAHWLAAVTWCSETVDPGDDDAKASHTRSEAVRRVVAESPAFAPQVTKVLGSPWLRVDEVVARL